jgi:hypothetical protein
MLHPVVLASIALLVVNDHVLKSAYPGFITGKLSDFAGLAFFPVLSWSALEIAWRRCASFAESVVVVVVVGLLFAATKTIEPAADAYRAIVGALRGASSVRFARDPTDLIALAALAVPIAIARRRV